MQTHYNDIRKDFSEKRDFHRMMINAEILLSFEDGKSPVSAKCVNLSGTGMLIQVDQAIEAETILVATMDSGSDTVTNLNAEIKVIRCRPADEEGKFLLGTEILKMK